MFRRLFTPKMWSTYSRLLLSIKPYKWIFACGVVATIFASAIDAGIAWTVKPILDKGLVAHQVNFLTWLPLLVVVVFVFRGTTKFVSDYCISRVGRSVVMDFRQMIFSHLLKLRASFYDRESSGKIISLIIYNVEQLAAATTDSLITILQQSLLAIGLIVVMFIISWHLTIFFMIVAPIVMGVMHVMTKRLRFLSHTVQKSVGDVTHIAREAIDGLQVIRTFGGEDFEKDKFDKATRINRHREMKVVVANGLGTAVVQMLVAVPIAILVYFMHISWLHISVGSVGAMIVAVLRLQTPLRRLTKVATPIQKGIAGAQSIYDLLGSPSENDVGQLTITRARGKIEYKNCCFSYSDTKELVINNVSFTIEPGHTVALVGHSGAGKSTLVNLLPRFYDLSSGLILLDDIDSKEYRLEDLRRQFSFVSQHTTLFDDTIANNIAYGRLEQTDRRKIIEATKAANFTEVIDALPDGYETLIGENGVMLSGGQRQRLAIARAILKDAPILILDEATSALDTESERSLQTAIDKLMAHRTTLVIAHRLSTVESADRIIVLDHGAIVEDGTHDELLTLGGYYSRLYKLQFNE